MPSAATRRIAATTAAKNFGTLVDAVRDHGTTYLIERHGRPVAQIGPVHAGAHATIRSLARYLKTTPKLDEEMLRHVEDGIAAANRPAVPPNRWER